MDNVNDKLNYLKNLILMMCCDGQVASREKKFLARAAKEIGQQVDNWGLLVKEVVQEKADSYPIKDRDRAIATLKSLLVMAKADKHVDQREKKFLVQFAKSIGVSNSQWQQIRKEIDASSLFDPFRKTGPAITILKEDFDKIDDFVTVAQENDVPTKVLIFDEFIAGNGSVADIVCFHASEDREATVGKCKTLLAKPSRKLVAVLTRYQGHQVKYLLEIGLKLCVIEPIYTHDIKQILATTK